MSLRAVPDQGEGVVLEVFLQEDQLMVANQMYVILTKSFSLGQSSRSVVGQLRLFL